MKHATRSVRELGFAFAAAACAWPVLVGLLLWGGLAMPAEAAAPMRLEDGRPLRWRAPAPGEPIRIELLGNTLNVATVYAEELHDAVVAGLQSWEEGSGGLVEFDYWQGPDPELFPAALENDGVSTIFFASAAGPELGLSRGTVAYTHLWVDEHGDVEEVDIVINDLGYDFTVDPLEVDVFAAKPVVLLRAVVLHELGHALGLDHSGVYDSTMFTWSWPGQDSLGCDDVRAIRHHLDQAALAEANAFGHVVDEAGDPVAGAHVLAVRADGTIVGSALCDATGYYNFASLDPDRYMFIVEPFFAGAEALSPGYAATEPMSCEGRPFARTFAGRSHETPLVDIEGTTSLGETTVGCGGGLQGPSLDLGLHPEDAPELLHGHDRREVAGFVRVPASEERWVRLTDIEGPLRIRATTYGVFSPISVKFKLYDAEGTMVQAPVARPRLEDATSGVVEWDTELEIDDLPRGDYRLEIGADRLIDTLYPRGDLHLDAEPFALISATLEPRPLAPACEVPVPNPAAYVSPAAPVPERDEEDDGAGCRVGGKAGGAPGWFGLWLLGGALVRRVRRGLRPRRIDRVRSTASDRQRRQGRAALVATRLQVEVRVKAPGCKANEVDLAAHARLGVDALEVRARGLLGDVQQIRRGLEAVTGTQRPGQTRLGHRQPKYRREVAWVDVADRRRVAHHEHRDARAATAAVCARHRQGAHLEHAPVLVLPAREATVSALGGIVRELDERRGPPVTRCDALIDHPESVRSSQQPPHGSVGELQVPADVDERDRVLQAVGERAQQGGEGRRRPGRGGRRRGRREGIEGTSLHGHGCRRGGV